MQIGSLTRLMLVPVRNAPPSLHSTDEDDADFRTNKPSDVISTLVSIYDSKDLFVKELQVLLAQRLLAISDGKFEKEVMLIIF